MSQPRDSLKLHFIWLIFIVTIITLRHGLTMYLCLAWNSLGRPNCSQTHKESPASASLVLGLKVHLPLPHPTLKIHSFQFLLWYNFLELLLSYLPATALPHLSLCPLPLTVCPLFQAVDLVQWRDSLIFRKIHLSCEVSKWNWLKKRLRKRWEMTQAQGLQVKEDAGSTGERHV